MAEQPQTAALRFSVTAWAKLLFLRDLGETEVGGFGITSADDLLLVQDVRLVRQSCTEVSVSFDDEAVADFFDEQVDLGLKPEQFGRIWVHTHPADSPLPSSVDEETFRRVFGRTQWAVMFVLARGGQTYARLRFNVGPGGETAIPASVDYSRPFAASDQEAWEDEYLATVDPDVRPLRDEWDILPQTCHGRGLVGADDKEEAWAHWQLMMDTPLAQMEDDDGYPF